MVIPGWLVGAVTPSRARTLPPLPRMRTRTRTHAHAFLGLACAAASSVFSLFLRHRCVSFCWLLAGVFPSSLLTSHSSLLALHSPIFSATSSWFYFWVALSCTIVSPISPAACRVSLPSGCLSLSLCATHIKTPGRVVLVVMLMLLLPTSAPAIFSPSGC
jgi:hypothetical protein